MLRRHFTDFPPTVGRIVKFPHYIMTSAPELPDERESHLGEGQSDPNEPVQPLPAATQQVFAASGETVGALKPTSEYELETERMLMAGDPTALIRLIELYSARVGGVLARQFKGRLDADRIEDVINASLHRVWKHRTTFDPTIGRLRVWFTRIAINLAKKTLRRESMPRPTQINDWNSVAEPRQTIESDRDEPSLLSRLQAALLSLLSPGQRAVIEADLCSPTGQADTAELVAMLETSPTVIWAWRSQARRKIRAAVDRVWGGATSLSPMQRRRALADAIADETGSLWNARRQAAGRRASARGGPSDPTSERPNRSDGHRPEEEPS